MQRMQLTYYKDGPCSNVAVLKFAQGDKRWNIFFAHEWLR